MRINGMLGFEVFDALHECAMLLDANGLVLEVNQSAYRLLGVGNEAVKGKFCYELLAKKDAFSSEKCCKGQCPLRVAVQNNEKCVSTCVHNQPENALVLEAVVTPLPSRKIYLMELKDVGLMCGLEDGIVHMCSFCHRIRDLEGNWIQIENFFEANLGTAFSHGVCNECMRKHYPEYWIKIKKKRGNKS